MLHIATQSDFPALYALLQDSFPADEYRSFEEQLSLLSDPKYTLWTTAHRNALISVWRFEDFTFIEHFAVAPSCRNHGLGNQLLQEIISSLPYPICLEAELPDTEIAQRRLNFYQRNGFRINTFPYVQPSYGPGRASVPMCILSTHSPLSQQQFHNIRDTLYLEVYKRDGRS